jgi:hypothetical protein
MMKICLLLFWVLSIISCQQHVEQTKFNKRQWNEKEDMDFPYREAIVSDLVHHHQLKGLSYKQLIQQVGEPARWDTNLESPYYEITVKYDMIDPIYIKSLVVYLNKDSVVTRYKVQEWKKD